MGMGGMAAAAGVGGVCGRRGRAGGARTERLLAERRHELVGVGVKCGLAHGV